MKQLTITIILLTVATLVFASAPVVSNVVATPSAGKVTITYDLAADAACDVTLLVSANNGTLYNDVPPVAVTGAIGSNVSPGTGKSISWLPGDDEMVVGSQYKVKVIARDNPLNSVNDDFISVAGGTFYNGTSNVTISSFYIDKCEVTQAEYQAVMGKNPSSFTNNPNRPVEKISWYNAIEYCNRRSIQDGLTPCYSYSSYGTNPNNWPVAWTNNHTSVSCSWTANGYRLPTEMEWVFAAKGGNSSHGYTYSGSNTVGNVAWYSTNSSSHTWDVGQLAANELGLYDLSGNVSEWCWDIFASYPSGDQTNPHGASTGSSRLMHGGSYGYAANQCDISIRNNSSPNVNFSNNYGFRVCRIAP